MNMMQRQGQYKQTTPKGQSYSQLFIPLRVADASLTTLFTSPTGHCYRQSGILCMEMHMIKEDARLANVHMYLSLCSLSPAECLVFTRRQLVYAC